MRFKNYLINILISIISLALFLGLTEIYFRIFNPQPITPTFYNSDPVYGVRMIPGLKGYCKGDEYICRFQLNSLGFRDEERSVYKPDGVYRIIGLGDSYSWGACVERDETFLERLEVIFNENSNNTKYEVFNWGVSAWGTAQQLLLLEREALDYKPDLIILQYFLGNDLEENMYSNIFKLDESGTLIRSYHGRRKLTRIKRIIKQIPFYPFLAQHSHFVNFMRLSLISFVEDEHRKYVSTALPDKKNEYGLDLTRTLLTRIFNICRENDIKIAMIIIPGSDDIPKTEINLRPSQKSEVSRERKVIEKVCSESSVPLLDFTDVFNQGAVSSIYFKKDIHFTPYGHKLAAESIAAFLKEENLL